MLFLIIRLIILALAAYFLWRLFREGYNRLRERLPRRRVRHSVEEPEMETLKRDSTTVLRLHLPGVSSERDINLKRFKESIELSANGSRVSFFKIIPLTSGSKVKTKKFVPPVLELEVE